MNMNDEITVVEATFGDHNFTMQRFMGREGLRVLVVLGKYLSKPMGELGHAFDDLGELDVETILEGDVNTVFSEATEAVSGVINSVAMALGSLFDKLGEQQAEDLAMRLLKRVHMDGQQIKPQTVDVMFQGKTFLLLRVMAWIITENYADFFEPLRGLKERAQMAVKKKASGKQTEKDA